MFAVGWLKIEKMEADLWSECKASKDRPAGKEEVNVLMVELDVVEMNWRSENYGMEDDLYMQWRDALASSEAAKPSQSHDVTMLGRRGYSWTEQVEANAVLRFPNRHFRRWEPPPRFLKMGRNSPLRRVRLAKPA